MPKASAQTNIMQQIQASTKQKAYQKYKPKDQNSKTI